MNDGPISPLVAQLIEASLAQTFAATDLVVEGLEADLDNALAELAAIREGVLRLLDGRYMPTPAAIERALYPSAELVEDFKRLPA